MIGESTVRTQLCPHCANSIQEDAANCPYCKADFSSHFVPQWLKRDEASSEPRMSAATDESFSPKFIWLAAMLVVALVAFLAGGFFQGSRLRRSTEADLKQLQAKEQIIQSQEAQLAQIRQQLNNSAKQLAETKAQLDQSQKELSLAQQRLAAAQRQVNSVNSSRPTVMRRTGSRASFPPTAATGQPATSGAYETIRPTSVHEGPSSASRALSQVESGTRINVVRSVGGWLEVRSRRGNPPGFVRAEDARQISATN